MNSLYLTQIQPNPPGRDANGHRPVGNQLNNEWVEFAATGGSRNLAGDILTNLTFTSYGCTITGEQALVRFNTLDLQDGQRVRVHTGSGTPRWEGTTIHVYLGRGWYVWNNMCGDRARLTYNGADLDWATYGPNPREGVLVRVPHTNRFA